MDPQDFDELVAIMGRLAQGDEGADHDIRSVDDDGSDLWIEAKGTTGRDGRFYWSAPEFRRAVRERSKYILLRVYEAESVTPKLRYFRDPIGMLLGGTLGIEVASFVGEVEPLIEPEA